MSATTVTKTPSALLRRIQSLCETCGDLTIDGLRSPDQVENVLLALQWYKDNKPYFLHDIRPIPTPFLPVPRHIKLQFTRLQEVLEVTEQPYGMRLSGREHRGVGIRHEKKRQFTKAETAWLLTMIAKLSLPIELSQIGGGHKFAITVLDHKPMVDPATRTMQLSELLVFSEENHPDWEGFRQEQPSNYQEIVYKMFTGGLLGNKTYERVRAFYGFAPLPPDARQFAY